MQTMPHTPPPNQPAPTMMPPAWPMVMPVTSTQIDQLRLELHAATSRVMRMVVTAAFVVVVAVAVGAIVGHSLPAQSQNQFQTYPGPGLST